VRVSENGRCLVDDDGAPFFYLADTAWGLLHAPTFEEVEHYLRVRKEQGFTVIMPVIVWALERDESRHGKPFVDGDPTKPNEPFFRHVDRVFESANALGLVVAPLPSWGTYVVPGPHAVITPENAAAYGEFLGRRYRDRDLVWVLGGDRNPLPGDPSKIPPWRVAGWRAWSDDPTVGDERHLASWRAMAAGIAAGDGGRHLKTYHPTAVHSSAEWLHEEPWLDFNMWQTSTWLEIDYCRSLLEDYARVPAKPFLDGETRYENSHRYFSTRGGAPAGVRMTPRRVRQAAYYAFLCGAMGHTYGCRDVWPFHVPSDRPVDRDSDTHWREAIRFPAAEQMRHLRCLLTDYPWHRLVPERDGEGRINQQQAGRLARPEPTPAPHLVVRGSGDGDLRVQAAVADDGSFALAYLPETMRLTLDLGRLAGSPVEAWWFDPTTGEYRFAQRFAQHGALTLQAPRGLDDRDHVLALRVVDAGR
jgi:hypothetical protein